MWSFWKTVTWHRHKFRGLISLLSFRDTSLPHYHFWLSLESWWSWGPFRDCSGLMPHREPDLLARFYGPFQCSSSLNTASCWPQCLAMSILGEEGGDWIWAKKGFTVATKHMWPCESNQIKKRMQALNTLKFISSLDHRLIVKYPAFHFLTTEKVKKNENTIQNKKNKIQVKISHWLGGSNHRNIFLRTKNWISFSIGNNSILNQPAIQSVGAKKGWNLLSFLPPAEVLKPNFSAD